MADVASAVVEALRSVYDPCCKEQGISVVDMGLVRSATLDGGSARVELLLTTGWCPFAASLLAAIEEQVAALPGVGEVRVEVVWDEPWTAARLSDGARRKLRFLPDPSAVPDRAAYLATRRDAPAGRQRAGPGQEPRPHMGDRHDR